MAAQTIDISVLGRILLSEFQELNSKKFKLAVIYSLMNGRACKIYSLSGRVLKLFQNKKGHSASFRLRIDEAVNSLIANRVLLRVGNAYSSLKLADNYLDSFNNLKMNIDNEEEMPSDSTKSISLVDSFAKDKSDYLPRDVISNQDEIIWFLRQVLIKIRQRAKDGCKDCCYFKFLAEFCFEYIDQAQFESHVDSNDKRFTNLSLRLKDLQIRAADEAMRVEQTLRP